MRARTLPELEAAAERHFRPGTTYSIFSVREETPDGVFLSYRAEAHLPEKPGRHGTSRRVPRHGGRAVPETGTGTVGGRRAGAPAPDGGAVTGRIIDPASGGPGIRVPGGGAVTGYNPETIDEIHESHEVSASPEVPQWRPGEIPAWVLSDGPGRGTAFQLLQDPGLDLPPGPAFATDDPGFSSLLDRAAPPGEEPARETSPGNGAVLPEDRAVAGTDEPQARHSAPGAGADGIPARHGAPGEPGRLRVVYVGLLDDPIEAAERCGDRRWSAAGVLNGGHPGADVVCFGLGDGSNVTRLAEGLHRYRPMRLILAVDASRKHADTQAWVRQVAQAAQPSSLVAVARTVTASPATVQELGYPVQYPG